MDNRAGTGKRNMRVAAEPESKGAGFATLTQRAAGFIPAGAAIRCVQHSIRQLAIACSKGASPMPVTIRRPSSGNAIPWG